MQVQSTRHEARGTRYEVRRSSAGGQGAPRSHWNCSILTKIENWQLKIDNPQVFTSSLVLRTFLTLSPSGSTLLARTTCQPPPLIPSARPSTIPSSNCCNRFVWGNGPASHSSDCSLENS